MRRNYGDKCFGHHKHQLNSAEIDGLPSEGHKQKIR